MYREAYRLETANVEKAKTLWRQVVDLVAPGSEYHAKATAKLRWYEHVQG